jgi:O-antigen ligase
MLVELRKTRFPVETGLLLALCFFLPLLEAPKNIAWAAYVICWFVNRVRARDFPAAWGGRWDLWDTLIAVWIASGFVVAEFAGLHGNEWRGTTDLVKYGSVLWLMKRSRYSGSEIRMFLGTLIASTVIGLAVGHWRMLSGAAKSGTLQLWSVGHVNHTAIYLAIVLGLCASWLFVGWRSWRARTRSVALAVTALVLASLIVTASRGAIAVGLALPLVIAAAWWPRWRAPLIASFVTVALVAAALFGMRFEVVRKHQDDVAAQNVLAFRDGIWRMGLVGWKRYPWFGVGMDNYNLITQERVQAWRELSGSDYDPASYVHFPHAHNLYVGALTERGIVGAGALAAVLIAWFVSLARWRLHAQSDDTVWLLWGCAAGAWFVVVTVGLVNSSLHDELGILASLLLGLWLSRTSRTPG